MDFLNTINDIFGLIADGFSNLIAFVKSIPDLFYQFYQFLPSPFNSILLAFIPIIVLVIFYKFVRGY